MEIRLPALGENIDSATVTRILVKVGDTIKKDQPIMELDTEKASVDVPSSAAGTIKEIRVKEGDTINVGQVVLCNVRNLTPRDAHLLSRLAANHLERLSVDFAPLGEVWQRWSGDSTTAT